MSSGAYVVREPIIRGDLVASYIMSTAAVGMEINRAVDQKIMASIKESDEKIREAERALKEISERDRRVEESFSKVIREIEEFRKTMAGRSFEYETVTDRMAAQEKVESTKVDAGLSDEDLLCMQIDADTGEVTYVVLDYSEALSAENAKNSAKYKKLSLASDIMKRILLMPAYGFQGSDAKNDFVEELNRMLDDDSVDFDYFRDTAKRRMKVLEEKYSVSYADAELWNKYCALCARMGKQPEKLPESKLAQAVEELLRQATLSEYYDGAHRAFFESVKELGMEIVDDFELVDLPGALILDSENPGFGMFFTDSEDSFLVELLDTEKVADTEEKKKQQENVCRKRKQLEALMAKKGYPLTVVTESDSMSSSISALGTRKKTQETAAESLRRKRAINGRKAKLKAAGGNR